MAFHGTDGKMMRGVRTEDRHVRRDRREQLCMSGCDADRSNIPIVIVMTSSKRPELPWRIVRLCELRDASLRSLLAGQRRLLGPFLQPHDDTRLPLYDRCQTVDVVPDMGDQEPAIVLRYGGDRVLETWIGRSDVAGPFFEPCSELLDEVGDIGKVADPVVVTTEVSEGLVSSCRAYSNGRLLTVVARLTPF